MISRDPSDQITPLPLAYCPTFVFFCAAESIHHISVLSKEPVDHAVRAMICVFKISFTMSKDTLTEAQRSAVWWNANGSSGSHITPRTRALLLQLLGFFFLVAQHEEKALQYPFFFVFIDDISYGPLRNVKSKTFLQSCWSTMRPLSKGMNSIWLWWRLSLKLLFDMTRGLKEMSRKKIIKPIQKFTKNRVL